MSENQLPPEPTQPENFVSETASQSEDVVSNLSTAAKLDVHPDMFVRNRAIMQTQIDTLKAPQLDSYSEGVAALSDQHKALIYGDPDNFNKLAKSVKRMGDAWTERVPREKERTDIVWEWMKNEKNITPEQRMRVGQLNQELRDIQGDAGFVESLPAEIVAGLGQMKEMGLGKASFVAGATITAGAAGAIAGSPAGPAGMVIGAMSTGGAALKWSLGGAMLYEGFKANSAQTYVQLNNLEDEKGNTLDYETKRNIALGVGALSAGVEFVANKYLMKTIPILNKLGNKQALTGLIFDPKNQAWRNVLSNIGKSVGANATSTGFQSIVSTLAQDLGSAGLDGDYSEMSVLNTLSKRETWEAAGQSAVAGGAVAGAIGAVFAPLNVKSETARLNRAFDNARPTGPDSTRLIDAPVRMDDGTGVSPDVSPLKGFEQDVHNWVRENNMDEKVQTAVKDRDFGQAIKDVTDSLSNNPQLRKDPTVMQKISESFISMTGLKKVYVDPTQILELLPNLKSDAIREKFTNILNRNDANLTQAPVVMPVVDLVNLALEEPKILDATLRTPESENAKKAQEFTDRVQAGLEKAQTELDKAKIDYKFEQLDPSQSVEGKVFYHGTGSDIKISDLSALDHQGSNNLYGNGVYLTDSPKIAEAYSKNRSKNKEGQGKILSAKLNNLNLIDLEKPLPEIMLTKLNEVVNRLWDDEPDQRDLILATESGTKAYTKVKEQVIERYGSMSDWFDFTQEIQGYLIDKGFDGFTHIGGKVTKGDPHNVAILFGDLTGSIKNQIQDTENPNAVKTILDKAFDISKSPDNIYEDNTSLEYITTENLPENIKAQMSDAQKQSFDSKIFEIRKDQVNAELDIQNKMADNLIDTITRKNIRDQMVAAEKAANADPDIKIVEKYLEAKNQKQDFIYRVDPAKLTEAQRKVYENSPTLKKIGFFKKDGADPETVLHEIGQGRFDSIDDMLATLDRTKTLKESLDFAKEYAAFTERDQANDLLSKNSEAQWQKYYSNKAQVHLDFMDMLKNNNWTLTKKLATTMAFRTPSLKKVKADVAIAAKTKSIDGMNPKIYKRAEANAHKAALKALFEGDILSAYEHKEQAAYAAAMTIEAHNAIRTANRVAGLIDSLDSDKMMQIMKTAGDKYEAARLNIIETYTGSVDPKRAAAKSAYLDWAKTMLTKNIGDFEIPERLVTGQQELSELSYGDIRTLNEAVSSLIHQGKMTDKLLRNYWARQEAQTVLDVVDNAIQTMKTLERPDRTPKMDEMEVGLKQKYLSGLRRVTSLAYEMDGYKADGPMQQVIRAVNEADNVKIVSIGSFVEAFKNHVEIFDKDGETFNTMAERAFQVETFKNNKLLRNGNLNEAQLFTMLLNMGNEGNKNRLENFGVRSEVILDVLKTYLKEKHFDLAQKMWNTLDAYKPQIEKVNKAVYGFSDVQWVQGTPFEAFGKEYSGGYYPIVSDWGNTWQWKEFLNDSIKDQKPLDEKMQRYFGLQEFTDTGHLKRRTGSKALIDLSPDHFFRSYEALIHDITMREVLTDTAKIFSDQKLADEMLKFFGNKADVLTFDKWLTEISNSETYPQRYGAAEPLVQLFQATQKNFAVAQLSLNVGTPFTQLFSLFLLPQEFNSIANGYGELAGTMKSLFANPELFNERVEFYAKHDPKLREAVKEYYDLQKAKEIFSQPKSSNKWLNSVRRGMRGMQESGFMFILYADLVSQVAARETAYQIARQGGVKGVDKNNEKAILTFANEMAARKVTANSKMQVSEFQRNRLLKSLMMGFQSGVNLIYNTMTENKHQIEDGIRNAKDEFKTKGRDGDYSKLNRSLKNTGVTILGASVIPALYGLVRSMKGNDEDFDKSKIAKEVALNALGPFPVIQGLMFSTLNDWSNSPLPIISQITMLKDAAQFSLYEAKRLAKLKAPKIPTDKAGKEDYKGFVYTATQAAGLPSRALWNHVLSPQAMKDNKRLYRKTFNQLRKEYEAFAGSEDFTYLDQEHQQEVSETINQLKKLENGDVSPIHQLNDATRQSDSTIESFDPQINKGEDIQIEGDESMKNFYKPATGDQPTSLLLDGKRYENVVSRIPAEEKLAGTNLGLKDYLSAVKGVESFGGRSNVKASTSSATGVFQFTDRTWSDVVKIDKKSNDPILTEDGRLDPVQQIRAMQILTAANADGLQRVGLETTAENLYLAHMLGISSAVSLLKADTKTDPSTLLKERVISNNAAILDKLTVSAVISAVKNKLDNGRRISEKIEKKLADVKPDLTNDTAWYKLDGDEGT